MGPFWFGFVVKTKTPAGMDGAFLSMMYLQRDYFCPGSGGEAADFLRREQPEISSAAFLKSERAP